MSPCSMSFEIVQLQRCYEIVMILVTFGVISSSTSLVLGLKEIS